MSRASHARVCGLAARAPAELAVWVGFLGIGLLVAGPLLGHGWLLLLDFPSGPAFPRIQWAPAAGASSLVNGVPLEAARYALAYLIGPSAADKAFLVAPFAVGGAGIVRLARRVLGVGLPAAIYAGAVYMVNPFVLDRALAGQLFVLLAMALLPWAAAPALVAIERGVNLRRALHAGVWLAVLAAVDLHVAGMDGGLLLLAVALTRSRLGERVRFAAAAFGCCALLVCYWVVPYLRAPGASPASVADLASYATRPAGWRVLPVLASLYGFWQNNFPRAIDQHPELYVLSAIVAGLTLAGVVLLARSRRRRLACFLALAGGFAILLAAGTSFPPTAPAFRFIYDHVGWFQIYREPEKFLVVLVLVYALAGAVALDHIRGRARRTAAAPLAVLAAVAVALGTGYGLFWGLGGQVKLSQYPTSWAVANRVMERLGPGAVLVFPWRLYAVWSFTGDRIVANPAGSFFTREVIVSPSSGLPGNREAAGDRAAAIIDRVRAHRLRVHNLGRLIAPLGARYVLVLHEADFWRYGFVGHQADLRLVYRSDRLALYLSTVSRPLKHRRS